ncbi:type I restriction-modification system, DNA-methyltransferase subunit M HsdM [Psychroflexus torquis ATCC 700755]|uniref:site-specific DNA-methyltransferase (adenine-specific) n=1 Tax=Psychroflexus torquis (strain ATCC 700755 / CIP 106069 / ACAM 623) TaxID=313595 RepID=K4IGM3_PSYTT|nr:N-6 DNA methylase [Psychroflexus torquis]AFU69672.1 type I restriction-modification system, DNA-methyltransferase subunit M HsdM [Psychroflexus torquis ATCC 700755]
MSILKHESEIWETADLLRGAGIKTSDFPKYMMPFFALLMVESRLIRESKRMVDDGESQDNMDEFVEIFQLEGLGYNDFVIREGKSLKDICKNDKTFDVDFQSYIKSFDAETKYLLGVDKGTEEEKFLDISGISGLLKKKRILFNTVKTWSAIDLTPYNNSEITTLEEHIKRKWADISAETAGEQYTPDDIISLITELIATRIEDNEQFLSIYDPTCGGGNLLFGVEDKINKEFNRPTSTFGEDWSDSLYALAKIESRFRQDSTIKYGNTLTDINFIEKRFDVIVANPPYGVDWKGFKKDIENDTTERFIDLPSISDGQFLFTQHILYQLEDDGFAVVVHNGSTLFSGDAGSGESNIRKHFFEQDWVEAIIQMPTDEFFNTGIYTYLWVFNKNKKADRKDKVMLLNASDLFEKLKKSKGKKRKKMNADNRAEIVKAFTDYKENEYTKIFDKWEFYFNKQSIMLTNVDENGKSITMPTKENREGELVEQKSIKIDASSVLILDSFKENGMKAINQMETTEYPEDEYQNLKEYYDKHYKNYVAEFNYKADAFAVLDTNGNAYTYNTSIETIIETTKKQVETELGNGKIVVKASYKKATKTREAKIEVAVTLTKDLQKDYEIINYAPIEATNQQNIANFMAKYITKPFEYIDNVVGVELNFNKVFYKSEILRTVSTITADLNSLENDLQDLEKELAL